MKRLSYIITCLLTLMATATSCSPEQNTNTNKKTAYTHEDAQQLEQQAEELFVQEKIEEAENLLRQAIDIRNNLTPINHLEIAKSWMRLAYIAKLKDESKKAKTYYLRSVAITESHLGPEHPELAEALLDAANIMRINGQGEEAITFLRRSLRIRQQNQSKPNLDIAEIHSTLGYAHTDLKQYNQAETHYLKSLEITESLAGKDNIQSTMAKKSLIDFYMQTGQELKAIELRRSDDTGNTASNSKVLELLALGQIHLDSLNFEKAEPLILKGISLLDENSENDLPHLIENLNKLGHWYYLNNKYEEAENTLVRAFNIQNNKNNPDQPNFYKTCSHLADLYLDQEKSEKALKYYQQALTTSQTLHGENNVSTARTNARIASCLLDLQQYEKALSYIQKSIDTMKTLEGKNSPQVATLLKTKGFITYQSGDSESAISILKEAKKIFNTPEQKYYPEMRSVYMTLSMAYGALKQYNNAIEELLNMKDHYEYFKHTNQPLYRGVLQKLFSYYYEMNDLDNFKKYGNMLFAHDLELYGPNSEELCKDYSEFAATYFEDNQFSEAEPYFLKALEILKTVKNTEIEFYARNSLAQIYEKANRNKKELKQLFAIIPIMDNLLKDSRKINGSIEYRIASNYRRQNQYQKAINYYTQSLETAIKFREEEMYPKTIERSRALAQLYSKLKKYEYAHPLYLQALTISKKYLPPDQEDIKAIQKEYDNALKLAKKEPPSSVEFKRITNVGLYQKLLLVDLEASKHYNNDQYNEAIDLLKQTISLKEQIFDKHYEDIAQDLNNLGYAQRMLENHQAAQAAHRRAINILKVNNSTDKNELSTATYRLGKALQGQGHYKQAIKYIQESLNLLDEISEKNNHNIAIRHNDLALLYIHTSQFDEADYHIQKAIWLAETVLQSDHSELIQIKRNRVVILNRQGKLQQAQELSDELDRIDTSDNFNSILQVHNNASRHLQQGNYNNAKTLFLNVLENINQVKTKKTILHLNSLIGLAQTYIYSDQYDKAHETLNLVLKLRNTPEYSEYPTDHSIYTTWALIYVYQDDYDTAYNIYNQALEIAIDRNGPEHTVVASIMDSIADCLYRLDQDDKALEICQKALDMQIKLLGDQHPETNQCRLTKGNILSSSGQTEQATAIFHQVLEHFENTLGKNHPANVDVLLNLAQAYKDLDQIEKSKQYLERAIKIAKNHFEPDNPILQNIKAAKENMYPN